jgi:glycine/D-amino acid oxidase-like deaminating enzyme
MTPAIPPSLWTATAIPELACPPLVGTGRADVCVVGGGFTGLSAALHLAEAGADVALLDAGEPGYGASGRNGGQVIPGLKLDPDAIEAWLGPDRGARVVELVGGAADFVFALVRRHAIACEARQAGWIKAAHTAAALRAATRTAREWARRGAPVEELDRRRIGELIGSEAYQGGFVDHRAGVVQPLSYARGLAGAALKAGVRIHGGTLATGLRRDGPHWVVSTPGGAVRAGQVVLGTNGYTDLAGRDAPWPRLAETVIPVHSYLVATRPLPEDLRRAILPKGQAVSDSHRLLRYFRMDGAGRLVMGGRGKFRDSSDPADYRAVMATVSALYPQLGAPEWEFVWGGRVALTLDHLPHLHELAPGVHAALGYNGRGVAMATVLGKCLADRVQGAGDGVFPATPLRPVPFHRWRRLGIAVAVAWKRTLDRLDDARIRSARRGSPA